MMRLALFAAVASAAAASLAATLAGRVVKVADGDTLTVLDAGKTQHKVRLAKIDAPEKSQAFGAASRKRLAAFVAGKDITVEWSEKDRYGRILGTVFEGGRDVNLEMVKDGMAWHYKRYDNTEEYADAEAEARRERRGLWRDANPTPPWEFRKSRRK